MKMISKSNKILGMLLVMVLMVCVACQDESVEITQITEPFVNDFSPKTGVPNTLVSITGTDFGIYAPAVKVYFGGIEAEVDSVANELVQVRVPAQGITGELSIKYFLYELTTSDSFTVLEGARITGLSPESGQSGDVITIQGERFGTDKSQVSVQFSGALNNVDAEVLSVTDTEINVIAPEGSITGPLTVTINPEVLETPTFVNEGVTVFPLVQAEDYSDMFDIQTEVTGDTEHPFWFEGDLNVGWTDDGDWVSFDGQNLDGAKSVDLRIAYNVDVGNPAEIEVRLGSESGTLISTVPITGTGGWQNWETFSFDLTEEITGEQSVYIILVGRTNINWFQFSSIKIADR